MDLKEIEQIVDTLIQVSEDVGAMKGAGAAFGKWWDQLYIRQESDHQRLLDAIREVTDAYRL